MPVNQHACKDDALEGGRQPSIILRYSLVVSACTIEPGRVKPSFSPVPSPPNSSSNSTINQAGDPLGLGPPNMALQTSVWPLETSFAGPALHPNFFE